MKYKIISIALLVAMSITSIVSCSNDKEDTLSKDDKNDSQSLTEVVDVTTEAEIEPDLPDKDFNGYEFTFLVREVAGAHWAPWNARDVFAEEENGNHINDAVYARNRYVEEKYNCVIKEYRTAAYEKTFRSAVMAQDDVFDVYYAGLMDQIPRAYEGFLYNLYDVPYIDLKKPWWNQDAIKSLSINKELFFAPSDFMILDNDCTSAIVFNKQLISDNDMENPYKLVENNQWTIDKLNEMSKKIIKDVNGDSIMDYNDMYGFVSYRDASISLMHGAGARIAEKDADDLPILTLGGEKATNALGKAFELMYNASSFNVHKLDGKFDAIYEVTEKMFMENRSLFYWILLHDIEKFRDMNSDFGILPIPKQDPSQESYGHTVNQYHSHALSIPITAKDLERTGIILEALSAKSKYTLQPAYYDITLQRKVARDNESSAMLDIIFNSKVYDVGAIYNFGGYSWDIIMMTIKNNSDIGSLYAKNEKRALTDIQKLVDTYSKLEN